jgi:hypothetical protein
MSINNEIMQYHCLREMSSPLLVLSPTTLVYSAIKKAGLNPLELDVPILFLCNLI